MPTGVWVGTGNREVEVAPLREAFFRSGRTASEIASILGWAYRSKPDSTRVRKSLGICRYDPGHGDPMRFRTHCSYDRAVEMARAIGVDPASVGL